MKSLENYGVQELKAQEIRAVQGGFLGFFLGFMVGMLIMDGIFNKK